MFTLKGNWSCMPVNLPRGEYLQSTLLGKLLFSLGSSPSFAHEISLEPVERELCFFQPRRKPSVHTPSCPRGSLSREITGKLVCPTYAALGADACGRTLDATASKRGVRGNFLAELESTMLVEAEQVCGKGGRIGGASPACIQGRPCLGSLGPNLASVERSCGNLVSEKGGRHGRPCGFFPG